MNKVRTALAIAALIALYGLAGRLDEASEEVSAAWAADTLQAAGAR